MHSSRVVAEGLKRLHAELDEILLEFSVSLEVQRIVVDHSEEMAAGIKGAVLTPIERCGHVSPLEQPLAVNTALRQWLRG